ncbi:MAG TPA: ABC transporter ATP-binding protein [Victivallales bacterium]|nr:ABC transporter ATP-binding protein [Victivallales bacterium]
MAEKIIDVENLSRSYGKNKAVNDISFSVEKGSVHGFLGPNGAGKTTVIKILLGLIMPDCGEIKIFGCDIFSNRKKVMSKVGAVVEAPAFFEYMTAYENLLYLAKFSGGAPKDKIINSLDIVGLTEVKDKTVGTFSYGMKQRLGIAQALLPSNELIFLDEPTNGLDPHGISGVRRLIRKLSKDMGVTVFLSSHLLSEVEQVCDRVSIIDKGRLICESEVSKLLQADERIELIAEANPELEKTVACDNKKIIESKKDGSTVRIVIRGSEVQIPTLAKKICDGGFKLYRIGKIKHKLEDIFVELTGKDNGDTRADRF